MVLSPMAAYAFNFITSQRSPIYWTELFGIHAFCRILVRQDKRDVRPRYQKNLGGEATTGNGQRSRVSLAIVTHG